MSCPSYTPSHCQDTDALFQIYAVSGPRLVGRAAGPAVIAFSCGLRQCFNKNAAQASCLTAWSWNGHLPGMKPTTSQPTDLAATAGTARGASRGIFARVTW